MLSGQSLQQAVELHPLLIAASPLKDTSVPVLIAGLTGKRANHTLKRDRIWVVPLFQDIN
jgi:hypothetical protein